jgi:hypothetical protein
MSVRMVRSSSSIKAVRTAEQAVLPGAGFAVDDEFI